MEHLILELPMLSPTSRYELQQFIKKNLALTCSHIISPTTNFIRLTASMTSLRNRKTHLADEAGWRYPCCPIAAEKDEGTDKLVIIGPYEKAVKQATKTWD